MVYNDRAHGCRVRKQRYIYTRRDKEPFTWWIIDSIVGDAAVDNVAKVGMRLGPAANRVLSAKLWRQNDTENNRLAWK